MKKMLVQTAREWPLTDTNKIPKGSIVASVSLEDITVLNHDRKPLEKPYEIGIRQLADGIRSGQFVAVGTAEEAKSNMEPVGVAAAPAPDALKGDDDQAGSLAPDDLKSLLGEEDVP